MFFTIPPIIPPITNLTPVSAPFDCRSESRKTDILGLTLIHDIGGISGGILILSIQPCPQITNKQRTNQTQKKPDHCPVCTSWVNRLASRIKSASSWRKAISWAVNNPCLKLLRALLAFPSSVRAPVDCSHGFHVLISSACRLRRSGVQPFIVYVPQ